MNIKGWVGPQLFFKKETESTNTGEPLTSLKAFHAQAFPLATVAAFEPRPSDLPSAIQKIFRQHGLDPEFEIDLGLHETNQVTFLGGFFVGSKFVSNKFVKAFFLAPDLGLVYGSLFNSHQKIQPDYDHQLRAIHFGVLICDPELPCTPADRDWETKRKL